MPVSRSPQLPGSLLPGSIVLIKRCLCVDGTSSKILLQLFPLKGKRENGDRQTFSILRKVEPLSYRAEFLQIKTL